MKIFRRRMFGFLFFVYISSMSNSHYDDDNDVVKYLIQYSVVALPDSVFFFTREFLCALGSWLFRQATDFFNNSLLVLKIYFFKFLGRRFFNLNFIFGHQFSFFSGNLRNPKCVLFLFP